ncbi:rhodanese-like domain-containing protein [Pareuzebyella sediminis]|uniref:rhodanese-like domain-containing protein n=1 Tax=Pareuzebyella sediminis TaxID=2607998 RepID=UPI0018E1859D|nr:rhodanese-like domain-containing protein [Pareuzebyella sediminis]
MKKIIVLFVLTLIVASCNSQQKGDIKVISIETLKADAIGKDVQLIDVRTSKEYEAGHIDDAVNIDFLDTENFAKEVNKLDKTEPIYIYCQMGGRSGKASQKLRELGFTTIFDYSGGYGEWNQKNK